jgi:hypothetical protein
VPLTLLLVAASVLNTVYLFTRVRLYHMHRQPDPVASPNASFVPADLDFNPVEPPSMMSVRTAVPPVPHNLLTNRIVSQRVSKASWRAFVAFWRFLLGLSPSRSASESDSSKNRRVQQVLSLPPFPRPPS